MVANQSGSYTLPAGASTITTRCTGQVSLTIPGSQTNTCSSAAGGSGMTNPVNGAGSVNYAFSAGSSARITVQ